MSIAANNEGIQKTREEGTDQKQFWKKALSKHFRRTFNAFVDNVVSKQIVFVGEQFFLESETQRREGGALVVRELPVRRNYAPLPRK